MRGNLTCLSLGHLRVSWMCSRRLVRRRGPIPIEQVAALPILADITSSPLQRIFLKPLRQYGISPDRVMACNSLFALAALASDGLGVTILPHAIVRDT